MRSIVLGAALALGACATPAASHTAPAAGATLSVTAEDRAGIERAVFDYFHGQGEGSAERLNRAFVAEHASMVAVRRGENGAGETVQSFKDMTEVLANWSRTPDPNGGNRDGEILSMDVVDGRLAVVIFRSTTRFYDALTLAKVNGEWRIIAKAFVLQ